MTLLGWLLGSTVVTLISGFDHWIAMLLLAWVGGRMILEGISNRAEKPVEDCSDPTRGSSLVMLSVATSIDALGVGLSLALLKVNVIAASLVIGAGFINLSRSSDCWAAAGSASALAKMWKCWAGWC